MNLFVPPDVIIALLSVIPYLPILAACNVPVYDDPFVLPNFKTFREFMRGWKSGQFHRHLAWSTIILNRRIGFERAWVGFDLIVHAVFTVLVFHVGLLFFPPFYAGIGALATAYHSSGVMAVTQIALGRPSMLCAVFLLAAILSPWWLILPLGFFAWASKEEAFALPGLLLLVWIAK